MGNDIKQPAASPSSHEANRRLAELLGWTDLFSTGGAWLGQPPGVLPPSRVPDWCGDWAACGPLQAQYVRRLYVWPHRVVVGTTPGGPDGYDVMLDRSQGETGEQLLRRTIVTAIIKHLEMGL
ncbi:hypothetical protein [Herbaspirillum sp. SJZ107]|uniref:hypothetical protein n=1 Tax=Herbaspirillum sp. SJZ107 TaxID=2572881 RepID=UPI0011537C01|nr:hypothetical protein [Herbaspirillum sp. SJZ107]TQK10226.1 hypothetical protein FBX97_0142 [Herbaspirillum sp. SJZ107]